MWVENVVERIPQENQWTHFYSGKKEYKQLDYILLLKSLAQMNPNSPDIMRKGLPYRAEKYNGSRFPNIGKNKSKTSDHTLVFIDIELGH